MPLSFLPALLSTCLQRMDREREWSDYFRRTRTWASRVSLGVAILTRNFLVALPGDVHPPASNRRPLPHC